MLKLESASRWHFAQPLLRLWWGPAARDFSLAYLHTLIHPVLRLKMTQNAQRFQIRALLIQRESSPFHMHLLEDAEQCQGESSQERCLQDLLQEMGWRWGSSPPSCIHHLHVHLASPVSPRSKARKACSPKAQAGTGITSFYGT